MSLQSLLGGTSIRNFKVGTLPNLRDVLQFYSNNWGKEGSDSLKEKFVAQALISFYEKLGIPILNEFSIKSKINKSVVELKKVLKFHSKSNQTVKNIEDIRRYQMKLDEIFEIRQTTSPTVQHSCSPSEDPNESQMQLDVDNIDAMEVDEIDGIFNENRNFS